MPDAKDGSGVEVTRQSFLHNATAAIAGVTFLPAGAACQRSKPVTRVNASGIAGEIDTFITGAIVLVLP